MKCLRRFLGDRLASGITRALAGYFLVLQAFVAALTCGMTVPVDASPRTVLCLPAQSASGAFSDQGSDHLFEHQCPCVICQGTEFELALAVAPGEDLGAAFSFERSAYPADAFDANAPPSPFRLGLALPRRGPPALSA